MCMVQFMQYNIAMLSGVNIIIAPHPTPVARTSDFIQQYSTAKNHRCSESVVASLC